MILFNAQNPPPLVGPAGFPICQNQTSDLLKVTQPVSGGRFLLWQRGEWTSWSLSPVLAFHAEDPWCQALVWVPDKGGKSQSLKHGQT